MAVMSYPDNQAINLFLGKPQQAQVTGGSTLKLPETNTVRGRPSKQAY